MMILSMIKRGRKRMTFPQQAQRLPPCREKTEGNFMRVPS